MIDEKFLDEILDESKAYNKKILDELGNASKALITQHLHSAAKRANDTMMEELGQLPDEVLLHIATGKFLLTPELEIPHQGLVGYAHEALISKKPKLWRAVTSNLQKEDLGKVKNLFYGIYLLVAEEAEQ